MGRRVMQILKRQIAETRWQLVAFDEGEDGITYSLLCNGRLHSIPPASIEDAIRTALPSATDQERLAELATLSSLVAAAAGSYGAPLELPPMPINPGEAKAREFALFSCVVLGVSREDMTRRRGPDSISYPRMASMAACYEELQGEGVGLAAVASAFMREDSSAVRKARKRCEESRELAEMKSKVREQWKKRDKAS